jgi:hypothetical protein
MVFRHAGVLPRRKTHRLPDDARRHFTGQVRSPETRPIGNAHIRITDPDRLEEAACECYAAVREAFTRPVG